MINRIITAFERGAMTLSHADNLCKEIEASRLHPKLKRRTIKGQSPYQSHFDTRKRRTGRHSIYIEAQV